MRQARRMCEAEKECVRCPLWGDDDGRMYCRTDVLRSPMGDAVTEQIVMDCAAAHPDPVYPSWYQYQETTFPGHTRRICPMMFGVECPGKSVTRVTCKVCRDKPIPTEIAEKLGIKPKEVSK